MLLVLIFALSNMGLAEVAEQVAESLPAAEPSVEEPVAEEVAPAEADDEGDVADIPVEEEDVADPEAPAEGEADADDTADAEFEVEDAAPVAESVSVEVQAIDVDALCAYETIEPEGNYDVSYKWERAESADGEWTELEETSDVLKSEDEDRAEYVYRCIVSVGDVTATSEPATFDWGAEAAPIDLGADFGLAQVNVEPEVDITVKRGQDNSDDVFYKKEDGSYVIFLDGENDKWTFELGETLTGYNTFTWTVYDNDEEPSRENTDIITSTTGGTETGLADVSFTKAESVKIAEPVSLYVKLVASKSDDDGSHPERTGHVVLHVLPKLSDSDITGSAKTMANGVISENNIGEGEEFKLVLDKEEIASEYGVYADFDITSPAEHEQYHFKDGSNGGKVYDAQQQAPAAEGDTALKFKVKVKTSNEKLTTMVGALNENETEYTVLPRPETIQILDDGEAIEETEKTIDLVAGKEDSTTLALSINDAESAKPAPENVWLSEIKWTVEDARWASQKTEPLVEIDGADSNAAIKDGTISIEVAVNDEAADGTKNPGTANLGPVVIKATGACWENGKLNTNKTLTWKINILPELSGQTITKEQIVLNPTEVGVPMPETDPVPDWAKFDATLNNSTLVPYGVTWSATGDNSSHVTRSSDNHFAAAIPADASAYKALFDNATAAADGVKVEIQASVKPGGNSVAEVKGTNEIILRPVADTITVKLVETNTTLKAKGEVDQAATNLPVGTPITLEIVQSNSQIIQPKVKFASELETVSIQRERSGDEATPDPEPKKIETTTNTIDWKPDRVGNYTLTVQNKTGLSKSYEFHVQQQPSKFELVAERTVAYIDGGAGKSGTDTIEIDVVATGNDASADVYSEPLTWSITSISPLTTANYKNEPLGYNDGEPTEHIWFQFAEDGGKEDPLKLELHTKDLTEALPAAITGGKLYLQASYTKLLKKTTNKLEFVFKPRPAATNLNGLWTLNAEMHDDNRDEQYTDGTDYFVLAQNSEATSTLDWAKEGAKFEELKANYSYEFKIAEKAPGTGLTEAQIAEWLTIDENGTISVKKAGANTALTDGDEEKEFNISLEFEGLDTLKKTYEVHVVSEPASAVFQVKADNGKEFYSPNVPHSLEYGDTIKLYAELRGPAKSAGGYRTTVSAKPDLVAVGKSGYYFEPEKDADGKATGYWILTPTGGSKATIKTGYPGVDSQVEIQLKHDTQIAAQPEVGETCTGGTNNGKNHVWQIVHVGDNAKLSSHGYSVSESAEPTAAGHYYVCQFCHKVSQVRPHTGSYVLQPKTDANGKAYTDEFLWKGPNQAGQSLDDDLADYGAVVCDVCLFECKHAGELTDVVPEGDHHVGTCSVCGQRVKQLHDTADGTGECPICHGASAQPKFVNAATGDQIADGVAVIGGDPFKPTLIITDVLGSWKVQYAPKTSADGRYIRVTKNENNETVVEGVTPTAEGEKATLVANVSYTDNSGKAQSTSTEIKIEVKSAVTNPTISADKTWIIADSDNTTPIKLTVDPGVENPDLSGFTWSFTGSNLKFVKEDGNGGWTNGSATDYDGKTVAYVTHGDSITFSGKTSVEETVTFAAGSVSCEQKITVLDTLANTSSKITSTNDRLNAAVAINGEIDDGTSSSGLDKRTAVPIVQVDGARVPIALLEKGTGSDLVAFDDRLGTVEWTITGKSGDAVTKDLSKGDIARYVEVVDGAKGKELLIHKNTYSELTKDKASATFTLTATVTLPFKSGDDAKTAKGVRDFTILPTPAEVTLQYATKETPAESDWKDVTDDAIELREEDTISFRPVVAVQTGFDGTATTPAKDVVFTWTADAFKEKDDEIKGDWNDASHAWYTATIIKDGAVDDITISATCPGFSGTIKPLKIKVVHSYTGITVSATPKYNAIDEETRSAEGAVQTKRTVTLTATGTGTNAKDEIHWKAYYPKIVDGKPTEEADTSSQATNTGLTWSEKTTGDTSTLTFDITSSTSRSDTDMIATHGAGLVFVAQSANNEDVKGSAIVYVYPAPRTNAALELETEKSQAAALTLVAGEKTKITKEGYALGYGNNAGTQPQAEVIEEKDSKSADATKNSIVQIVTENGERYIKGIAEGTAKIAIKSYLSTSETETDATHDKIIEVTVQPGISEVRFEGTDADKTLEIAKGATKDISNTTFVTYRKTTNDAGIKQTQKVTGVTIELSDPSGKVEITPTDDGWTIKGVEPGTATLTATAADAPACTTTITVNVIDAVTGVKFYEGEELIEGQYPTLYAGETQGTPFTLTAKVDPLTAKGDVKIIVTKTDPNFKYQVSEDQASITITPPETGTAAMAIQAQVKNPAFGDGDTDSPVKPEYLKANLDVIVVNRDGSIGDEPGPSVGAASLKVIGKTAIGPNETTEIAVIHADPTQAVWTVKSGSATVSNGIVTGGTTPGTAVIEATVGDTKLEQSIEILKAPEFTLNGPETISLNETVALTPDFYTLVEGSYTFADSASATVGEEEISAEGLVSFRSETPTTLSVKVDENGLYTATAIKKGDAKLTMDVVGGKSVSKTFTVAAKANTGFNIGAYNGATVYAERGAAAITIPVTYKPSNKYPCNLTWTMFSDYEGEGMEQVSSDESGLSVANGVIKAAADARIGTYQVVVSADGFAKARPTQSFYVIVCDKAGEGDALSVAADRVGVDIVAADYKSETGSITAFVGEKLQLRLVDENGDTVPGAAFSKDCNDKVAKLDANTHVLTIKGKNKTITISANGATALTISTKAKPAASKVVLDPKTTSRTVAIGETFKLDVSCKDATGTNWYNITSSSGLGFAPAEVLDAEGKAMPGYYSFSEAGTTTLTIKTTWGVSKTVKFTVVGQPMAEPSDISLSPEHATLTRKGTVRVKAVMEDSYANLTWTVGGTVLTKTSFANTTVSKIQARLISNNEIEIKSNSAAADTEIPIVVTAPGDEDIKLEGSAKVVDAAQALTGEAEIVFDKNMIGVNEQTTASLVMKDGSEISGNVTFKCVAQKKKTGFKASGSTITATKTGDWTVQAYLDGKDTAVTGTLHVIPTATISLNIVTKKMTMGMGEDLDVQVHIGGYDKPATLPEGVTYSTEGLLGVNYTSDLVTAELEPVEPDDPDAETRDYILHLHAGVPVKNAKGAYTSSTVTVKLNNWSKTVKKDLKIQVLEASDELYFPSEIYLAQRDKLQLKPAYGDGTLCAANIAWDFATEEDRTKATAAGVSFTDGYLTASKTAQVGVVFNIHGESHTVTGDFEFDTKVTTAKYGAKSKQKFSVHLPKTTIGVSEKLQPTIQASGEYASGNVKWTLDSKSKAIATINATTGLIVAKKTGTIKISASVKGKKASANLTIVADPTSVSFKKTKYGITPNQTLQMGGEVVFDSAYNYKAANPAEESVWMFEIDDPDGVVENENFMRSGELKIKQTAANDSQVKVTVRTMNGLTAHCLLVVGDTADIGTQPTPELVPASIVLRIAGDDQTGNTITLNERDEITPEAVVKTAQGITIPDVALTWTASSPKATIDPATGKLVAKTATFDASTGNEDNVRISATCTQYPSVTAYFEVKIEEKMSEDHIELQQGGKTLTDTIINKNSLTGVSVYVDTDLGPTSYTWELETKDPDVVEISGETSNKKSGDQSDAANANITLVGKQEGTAELVLTVKSAVGGDNATYTKSITMHVNKLPTESEITITGTPALVSNVMTLGTGEPASFTVTLPEDKFGENPDIEVKAYKLMADGSLNTGSEPDTSTEVEVEEDTGATVKAGKKYTITLGSNPLGSEDEFVFGVQVTAFKETKTEFRVKVLPGVEDMDDITVETTPVYNKTAYTTHDIYVGVGEPVTLKMTEVAGLTYTQGFTWYIDEDNETESDPAVTTKEATITLSDNGKTAEINATRASTVKVCVERNGFPGTSHSGKLKNGERNNTDIFTINYLPQPTATKKGTVQFFRKYDMKKPETASFTVGSDPADIEIGVNETMELSMAFNTSSTAAFSQDIHWESKQPRLVSVTADGAKTTVKGISPTGADSYAEIVAYTGSGSSRVDHATFKVVVKDELKALKLVNSSDKKAFENKIPKSPLSEITVTIDRGENDAQLATCQLTCSDSRVTVEETGRNTWTLQGKTEIVGKTFVTLTLTCDDLGLEENFTAIVE